MEGAAVGESDWTTGVVYICIASAGHLWSAAYFISTMVVNFSQKKKSYCNFIELRIKYKNRCSCILFFWEKRGTYER